MATLFKGALQQQSATAREREKKEANYADAPTSGALVFLGQDPPSLTASTPDNADLALVQFIASGAEEAQVSDDRYEGAMFFYPDGENISAPDPSTSAEDPSINKPSANNVVMVLEANGAIGVILRSDFHKGKGVDRSSRFRSPADNGEGSSGTREKPPMTVEDLEKVVAKQMEDIVSLECEVLQARSENGNPARYRSSNDDRLRHDLDEARFDLAIEKTKSASLEDLVVDLEKASEKNAIMDTPDVGQLVTILLEQNPVAIFDAIMYHPQASAEFRDAAVANAVSISYARCGVGKPNKMMRTFDGEDTPGLFAAFEQSSPFAVNNVEMAEFATGSDEEPVIGLPQTENHAEESSFLVATESLETAPVVEEKRLPRKFRNSRRTHEMNGTLDKKRPAAHRKVNSNNNEADEQDEKEKTPVPEPGLQEPQIMNAGNTGLEHSMPEVEQTSGVSSGLPADIEIPELSPINYTSSSTQTQASQESGVGIEAEKVQEIPALDTVVNPRRASSKKTVKNVLYCPRCTKVSPRRRITKIKKKAPNLSNHPQKKEEDLNEFPYGLAVIAVFTFCCLMVYPGAPALRSCLTTVVSGAFSLLTAARTSLNFSLPTCSTLEHVVQETVSITASSPESIIGDLLGWTHQSEGAKWNLHDTSALSCPPPVSLHLHMNSPSVPPPPPPPVTEQ
ncbi:hypothetical protein IFR05_001638 [Cadophora sp. M221]|nr:hypothetical protein IFR05_001638 [Cadophora sp. M221]